LVAHDQIGILIYSSSKNVSLGLEH
jgi:hypothetical protein